MSTNAPQAHARMAGPVWTSWDLMNASALLVSLDPLANQVCFIYLAFQPPNSSNNLFLLSLSLFFFIYFILNKFYQPVRMVELLFSGHHSILA